MFSKLNTLVKNTSYTLFIRVSGAFLVFFVQVLLARGLGATEYGIYVFVISCISIMALVAGLGFDTSLTRFVPAYLKSNDWPHLRGIIRFSHAVSIIAALILVLFVFVFCFIQGEFQSRESMLFAMPLMFLLVLTNIRITLLRSFKQFVLAVLPESVFRPVFFIVIILVSFLLQIEISAKEAVVFQILAAATSFLLGGMFLKLTVSNRVENSRPKYLPRIWLSTSLPMLFTTGSTYIISQTDIVMLGLLKEFSQSGIYNAASRVASVAIFFMAAVNFVAAPTISEIYTENNRRKLNNFVIRCTRMSFVMALSVFTACAFLGTLILNMFGDDFVIGYYALMCLLTGHLLNTAVGPVALLLSLTGRHNFVAKILGVFVIINVILNYFLINEFGFLGAAISTMATTIAWNFLMFLKVRRELGINTTVFGRMLREES